MAQRLGVHHNPLLLRAGKDCTVNHVHGVLNPRGAPAVGFKKSTPDELAHDFLRRVHSHVQGNGAIAIFDRSHYTRVHKLIDRPTWLARCHRIRQFEDLLIETGTNILKFYLHISKQERLARFTARLEDPARSWKINESNYYERVYRDDYVAAFEDAMLATSTKDSPWFIMPANHNWFRNLAVSQIIADTMEGPHMSYPKRTIDLARDQA
jgi:polyphosphate kinase 2 (PPK2 family)